MKTCFDKHIIPETPHQHLHRKNLFVVIDNVVIIGFELFVAPFYFAGLMSRESPHLSVCMLLGSRELVACMIALFAFLGDIFNASGRKNPSFKIMCTYMQHFELLN